MSVDKSILRSCIFYEWRLGHSARSAAANLCTAFGESTTTHTTVNDWFKKFTSGDTSLENEPRGRPMTTIDDDILEQLIQDNPRLTTREMAAILSSSHTTIERHLHALGKINVACNWIPHKLTEAQKETRVSVCTSLFLRPHRQEFLNQIITGDEKWALYSTPTRKHQWKGRGEPTQADPKPDAHPPKVMLSFFWDSQGILLLEFLPLNVTVTAAFYSAQLQRLAAAVQQKRPGRTEVCLLHDNARPHMAKLTRATLEELGWEVLPHPAYSPDMAPTDFHVFRALSNHLQGKDFKKCDDLKQDITRFFESQNAEFYARGIEGLPARWGEVIDKEGEYITK